MRKYMMLVERVYHGTPAAGIERFDTKHVGSGEGNQAYGWGLYFASEKQVAEFYHKGLTKRDTGRWPRWLGDHTSNDEMRRQIQSEGYHEPAMQNAVIALSWFVQEYKTFDAVIEFIENLPEQEIQVDWKQTTNKTDVMRLARDLYIPSKKGALYTVEIPDESEFLLWDEPLLNQSQWVIAVIERLFVPMVLNNVGNWRNAVMNIASVHIDLDTDVDVPEYELKERVLRVLDDMTGAEIYEVLCEVAYNDKGGDFTNYKKRASLFLLSKRIHGIKYKDQFSRAGGVGTYNYVVFDGAFTKIVGSE